MNLINDAWIPVRRKNGDKVKIAPWQITEGIGTDKEIVELAVVRPDFDGALIQFLIGLLQTTCAPKQNSDWRLWLNNPPSVDELKKKFEPVAFAFNLDGAGPRFMQEFGDEIEQEENTQLIEKLCIDAPGEQALKKRTDFFIKRDRAKMLCWNCCVQALITLQINAPAGGRGIRVGLRGGGPVSTVIAREELWGTLWHNVLSGNEFMTLANKEKILDGDKFPWCAKTRTSENDNSTTPQDVHPTQIYWSMPRRIRLIFTNKEGRCDLCHEMGQLIESYYTKHSGVKYNGFVHPLTPTYKNKDGLILSVHQHEAIGYRYWLGYIQTTNEGNEPARVINAAFSRRLNNFRLWAFGYDMDNMKACCWYEGVMPVVFIEDEMQWEHYNSEIAVLIRGADEVCDLLSYAVSDAMKEKKKKDKNYTRKIKAAVNQRFWQETEPEFYRQIALLRDEIMVGKDGLSIRQAWHKYLVGKAQNIFDDMSQSDLIDQINAERVAKAYNELRKRIYGKKLKVEILGLPKTKEGDA
ncbi:type I-E CRISPR-associated protein Cse1/CasA [bacterium]|jgi:CRISPR system Cascade subunit CasA|nr:type I-E CRISPR-associated protein Cse1/CasA [bacterium]